MLGGAGASDGGVGAMAAEEEAAGAVVDPVTGPASGAPNGFAGGADALEAAGGSAVEDGPPAGRASSGFAVDALGGFAEGVLLSNRGVASPCADPVGSE